MGRYDLDGANDDGRHAKLDAIAVIESVLRDDSDTYGALTAGLDLMDWQVLAFAVARVGIDLARLGDEDPEKLLDDIRRATITQQ